MGREPIVPKLVPDPPPSGDVAVVVQSLSRVDSLQPHGLQHARLSCPSPSPGVCLNSCPLIW